MSEEVKDLEVTENPTVEEPETKPEVKTVTMTQEELDALIGREKGRVKKKYEDYDDLKLKLAEYEQQVEEKKRAEMTELEKLQADLLAKDESAQTLAQQLEALQTQMKQERIVNAFIKAAPSVNIPSDRIDAALKLADLSAVTVGEDGTVEGIDELMGSLVQSYKFLAEVKKPQKQIGASTNGPKDNAGTKTAEQLLHEAAEKARLSGRAEDRVAYANLKRELGL
ncbi:Clp protease ClpB [Heyndrickxia oleronia]|uniref:Clp protease ClpB n=1 Tax=Heyndrickxia oleronia TaxID=38875 RepID=A0AAW6SNV6_9BACI|nr:Clp protease ClpB [Heyndrickxia oleronia]MDH5159828.1 Clp protease ClpB [Heyndrickxia oleronia]